MKDYVVLFSGKDNLSPTIDKIKLSLSGVENKASKLDDFDIKFKKIEGSAKNYQRRIKEINNLMAEMNVNGLGDTTLYTKMAAAAANYTDALGDARTSTRLLSSDTLTLDAGIKAFLALTGAASVCTGVMGLLGSENKDLQKAMLKVQLTIQVLNGILSLLNALNKDSVLILKLKQIQISLTTAATTKNTVAEGANTVAVTANTVATQAWNVAKAIGKALLGDFSGLLLVGAGALATYAIATSGSEKEQEKLNKTTEKGKEIISDYSKTISKSITTYNSLKQAWNQLKNTQEKDKFIKDNADKFKELGISIDSVKRAEDVFVSNTSSVVKALEDRAKAQALQNQLTREYEKFYTKQAEIDQKITEINNDSSLSYGQKTVKIRQLKSELLKASKGMEANISSITNKYEELSGSAKNVLGEVTKSNKTTTTKSNGKKKIVKLDKDTFDQGTLRSEVYDDLKKQFEEKVKQFNIGAIGKQLFELFLKGINDKAKSWNFEPFKFDFLTNNLKLIKEYDDACKQVQDIVKQYNLGLITYDNVKEQLALINSKLPNNVKKIELNAYIPEEGSVAYIQKMLQNIKNRLTNENLSIETRLQLLIDATALESELDRMTSIVEEKVSSMNDRISAVADGLDAFKGSIDYINNLSTAFDNCKNPLDYLSTTIGLVTSALDTYQSVVGAVTKITEIFSAATTAAATADTAATTQQVSNSMAKTKAKLAETGAESGEAIAGATASGAELPFPYNLAAIAAGVAAVIAALAAISSLAFADGGIVPGTSYSGDKVMARLNSGEMVLNSRQLRNLFKLVDGGTIQSNNVGNVTFELHGDVLKGAINNYDKKTRRL